MSLLKRTISSHSVDWDRMLKPRNDRYGFFDLNQKNEGELVFQRAPSAYYVENATHSNALWDRYMDLQFKAEGAFGMVFRVSPCYTPAYYNTDHHDEHYAMKLELVDTKSQDVHQVALSELRHLYEFKRMSAHWPETQLRDHLTHHTQLHDWHYAHMNPAAALPCRYNRRSTLVPRGITRKAEGDYQAIIMEYISGGTVTDYVDECSEERICTFFSDQQLSAMMGQLFGFLSTVGKLYRFSHRDLNTNNIMFVPVPTTHIYKYLVYHRMGPNHDRSMYIELADSHGMIYKLVDYGLSYGKLEDDPDEVCYDPEHYAHNQWMDVYLLNMALLLAFVRAQNARKMDLYTETRTQWFSLLRELSVKILDESTLDIHIKTPPPPAIAMEDDLRCHEQLDDVDTIRKAKESYEAVLEFVDSVIEDREQTVSDIEVCKEIGQIYCKHRISTPKQEEEIASYTYNHPRYHNKDILSTLLTQHPLFARFFVKPTDLNDHNFLVMNDYKL